MDQKNKLEAALYVVSTPIGNLQDITLRALKILKECDFVICEDSRVAAKLLSLLEIKDKKMIIYNDHSSQQNREKILNLLINKNSLALISDAGTPLISDPGFKLVRYLRRFSQKIIPICGPSSITAAISVSGIACDNFLFLGFLPSSEISAANYLKTLPTNFSLVFFESPSRIIKTLKNIENILGDRMVCVAKELTKIHEEIFTDKVSKINQYLSENKAKIKGEFVIIIEKEDKNLAKFSENEIISEILKLLDLEMSIKEISQNLSEIYQINKKVIYQLAIAEINKRK
jgi:16S rRNA (cytidine1402-2'-O)-methyltransferase